MTQVMREAQHLIPCEHCTIIVLDQENQEVGWERMYALCQGVQWGVARVLPKCGGRVAGVRG